MKTSIVLATYNGEEYIEQQLQSIVKQNVLPNEIIIMDDNSSDTTVAIVEKFISEFNFLNIEWIIVKNTVNQGYIKNFITGILKAKHEIIFTCDQDDLWLENKISDSLLFFLDNPQMIALHSNTKIIDKENNIIIDNFQEYSRELEQLNYKKFSKKINYPGMALCFKAEKIKGYLQEIMVNNYKIPTHDWTICFLAMEQDGFYVTKNCYTLRRFTGENVALQLSEKRLSGIERRLDGVKLYKKHFNTMINLSEVFYFKNNMYYMKLYENSKKREFYIENNKIVYCIKNIQYIKYYPSIKAYLADLIVLSKIKSKFS